MDYERDGLSCGVTLFCSSEDLLVGILLHCVDRERGIGIFFASLGLGRDG